MMSSRNFNPTGLCTKKSLAVLRLEVVIIYYTSLTLNFTEANDGPWHYPLLFSSYFKVKLM